MNARSYVYREKSGSGAEAPLLFLFHSTGGDEDQLFDVGGHLLPQAHLIAPRGDVSEHGALRYFRRLAEGRYDMSDLVEQTERMAGFVAARIGAHRPSAVYGLGYSNGANILASVAFVHPELFDGMVLMHPLIPFAPPPAALGGRRVLITAGRRDPIAPARTTEALASYFAAQGASVRTSWHEGGHEVRQEEFSAASEFLRDPNPDGDTH